MFARVVSGLALAFAFLRASLPDRVACFAFALPYSAFFFVAEFKMRDVDLRKRNRDGLFALASEHFTVDDVLFEILLDLPFDDVAEAGVVPLYRIYHWIKRPFRPFWQNRVADTILGV